MIQGKNDRIYNAIAVCRLINREQELAKQLEESPHSPVVAKELLVVRNRYRQLAAAVVEDLDA